MKPAHVIHLLLLAALPAIAAAQTPPGPPAGAPPPGGPPPAYHPSPIHAVRITEPVTVDGVLDEAVWKQTPPVTEFFQSDDREGELATERTEARIAFDDEALYVAARMWDAHPDSIVSRLCRRDDTVSADRFGVFLDPFHDKRSGYYFIVNAAGVLADGTLFNDSWDDNSWDGVWQARVRIDREGWTAEMRIPFSQLRFSRDTQQVWGIDLRREITRRNERDWIMYPPRKESGFVSRFPELLGLQGLNARTSIELLPYATSKAEYRVQDAGDPFRDDARYTPSGGADLRMSVGGNLTLNATVNPDFGQVEVDPAVVNLSDVESYFQEKRPFFVENARIFSFGNEGANDYWGFNWPEPTFFYSRRIGRSPQRDLSVYDYTDVPVATRILGAAKLTGKLAPGFNFGTMHALTARETGRLDEGGLLSRQEVEPLTYYGVARGLREFKEGRNGLGMIGTLVSRRFQDGLLEDELNRTSLVSGLDGWHFLDKKKVWVVSGYSAFSHVSGTTDRLIGLQRGSRHYFQRPDQDYVSVDSSATSMTGWVSRYWVNKQGGDHFIFNSAIGAISPRFDTGDIGFQSRSDVINGHLGMGWGWNDPTKWRKWANIIAALYGVRDFEGNTNGAGIWSQTQIEFINNYSFKVKGGWSPETMSGTATRGGPAMVNRSGYSASTHFDTDSRSRLFWSLDLAYGRQTSGSWNGSVTPSVELKPVSSLLLSAGPSLERNIEDAQYVTTQTDPLATGTHGERDVFGRLEQTTLSMQFRLNWSFTPNLCLQTYVQPLISAGRYSDLKELARPRSYDFVHYNRDNGSTYDPSTQTIDPDGAGPAPSFVIDDPNFNYKSLRGNAVLRWEYAPGSTLYLVWTQERSDSQTLGDFEFGPNLSRLVEQRPNNIFLVKATYYLSR